jgi:uncharacterized protein
MNKPESSPPQNVRPIATPSAAGGRHALLARYPWLGYVLPLVVFMVGTSLEPTPTPAPTEGHAAQAESVSESNPAMPPTDAAPAPEAPQPAPAETGGSAGWFGVSIPYCAYPIVYTLKLAFSVAAIAFVWPTYRQFPWRLSPVAFVVGVVGVVLWVGISDLHLERRLLDSLGLGNWLDSTQRSAFNPLVELAARPAAAWGFLTIRFIGLALVVPLIEEFFLRGFLMRACVQEDWTKVPFGTVNLIAVAVGTAVPMAMHPNELLAALVWFSMITGLMVLPRNIWDCVAAHATTNLLLGVYVVIWNQWQLM